jgi:hypothetical protein
MKASDEWESMRFSILFSINNYNYIYIYSSYMREKILEYKNMVEL